MSHNNNNHQNLSEDDDDDDGILVVEAPRNNTNTTTDPFRSTDPVIESWRERERRPRTFRILLLFLLCLLLTDDEPRPTTTTTKHSSSWSDGRSSHLRRGRPWQSSSSSTTSSSTTSWGTHTTVWFSHEVWDKRQRQEAHLQAYTRQHARYQSLMHDKNDGRDVASDIHNWLSDLVAAARRQQQQQQQQAMNATQSTPVIARSSSQSNPAQVQNNKPDREQEGDDDEEHLIWHYPWNTTGFYRGQWKRLAWNDTLDATSQNNASPPPSKETTETLLVANHSLQTVTAQEVEPILLDYAKQQSPSTASFEAGIYWLPPGLELELRNDHNLTTLHWDQMTVDTTGALHGPSLGGGSGRPPLDPSQPSLRSRRKTTTMVTHEMTDTTPQTEGQPPQSTTTTKQLTTLTRSDGRAALQLYSRSIPGMKELSLVDGFVKLYNGAYASSPFGGSSSYAATTSTTKQDVLIRVRGVLLHGIGRLSLISSQIPASRSALVLEPSYDAKEDDSQRANPAQQQQRLLVQQEVATISTDAAATTQQSLPTKEQQQQQQEPVQLPHNNNKDPEIMSVMDNPQVTPQQNLDHKTGSEQAQAEDPIGTNKVGDHVDETNFPEQRRRRLEEALQHHEDWDRQSHVLEQIVDDATILVQQEDKRRKTRTKSSSLWKPLVSTALGASENDGEQEEERRRLSSSILDRSTQTKDTETKKEPLEKMEVAPTPVLPAWSDHVIPFPYVYDDEEETLRRTRTPGSRHMPPREQGLESNALGCPFRLSLDVQETQWTLGEYRTLLKRKWNEHKLLDPHNPVHQLVANSSSMDNSTSTSTASVLRKTVKLPSAPSATTPYRSSKKQSRNLQDQALVVHMVGNIYSEECHFAASLNVTALRTDWDTTTNRAINYSFNMMLVCLVQIVLLLRQLLHSQTQSTATRVSMICIGWQTVLDALICLGHIYLCLAMQPLFTAFASVAFFKCLIFCVIEMKYMAIIINARNSANGGQPLEVLRRQVAILHLRFYLALLAIFLLLFNMTEEYRLVYMLGLYSFWVPQIILNAITEAKAPMHKYYIYGMSITRLIMPLYMYGIRNNFLREVYPEAPYDPYLCQWLVLWVALQTGILIGQGKYGARFWIPPQFLPPKYDYSRPIPPSILNRARPTVTATTVEDDGATSTSTSISSASKKTTTTPARRTPHSVPTDSETTATPQSQFHATSVTTRNRMRRQSNHNGDGSNSSNKHGTNGHAAPSRQSSRTTKISRTTMTTMTPTPPTASSPSALDCSICYEPIDVVRQSYMLAPCDHLFHRDCLMQWMDIKMECPICRTDLPPL